MDKAHKTFMYCSKAEGMLLAGWLCMPVCICREMEMLVWGVSESRISGIPTTLVPVSPYEQLPQLRSAWGKAELMLTSVIHQCRQCPFSLTAVLPMTDFNI